MCKKETLLALVSDTIVSNINVEDNIKIFNLNDIDEIADFLFEYIGGCSL